jgi:hypothetical protein
MVFKAAKHMYHGILGPGIIDKITEDEAWRDADEFTKQEYAHLAWLAWQRLMHGVPELGTISVGACRCEDNGVIGEAKYFENQSSPNCNTCGGRRS